MRLGCERTRLFLPLRVPRLFEKFNESHKSEFLITKQLFSREKFFRSVSGEWGLA
jgi:hypothetical protein